MKSESMYEIVERRRKEGKDDEFDNWAMEYLFNKAVVKRLIELKDEKNEIEEYYKKNY